MIGLTSEITDQVGFSRQDQHLHLCPQISKCGKVFEENDLIFDILHQQLSEDSDMDVDISAADGSGRKRAYSNTSLASLEEPGNRVRGQQRYYIPLLRSSLIWNRPPHNHFPTAYVSPF